MLKNLKKNVEYQIILIDHAVSVQYEKIETDLIKFLKVKQIKYDKMEQIYMYFKMLQEVQRIIDTTQKKFSNLREKFYYENLKKKIREYEEAFTILKLDESDIEYFRGLHVTILQYLDKYSIVFTNFETRIIYENLVREIYEIESLESKTDKQTKQLKYLKIELEKFRKKFYFVDVYMVKKFVKSLSDQPTRLIEIKDDKWRVIYKKLIEEIQIFEQEWTILFKTDIMKIGYIRYWIQIYLFEKNSAREKPNYEEEGQIENIKKEVEYIEDETFVSKLDDKTKDEYIKKLIYIYRIEIRYGLQFKSIPQRNEYLRIVKEIQMIEHRTQLKFTSVQEKQYYERLLQLLKQIEERNKPGLRDDNIDPSKPDPNKQNDNRFVLITVDKYKLVYSKLSQQIMEVEDNY